MPLKDASTPLKNVSTPLKDVSTHLKNDASTSLKDGGSPKETRKEANSSLILAQRHPWKEAGPEAPKEYEPKETPENQPSRCKAYHFMLLYFPYSSVRWN